MRGVLYASDSSARHDVEVHLQVPGRLQLRHGREVQAWPFDELAIEPRVAGCPAVVEFPDGSRLEIQDAAAFYGALGGGQMAWVHALERHWIAAVAFALVSIALVAWFALDGIPVAARIAANLMPEDVHELIGREGMDAMDRLLFEPTEISEDREAGVAAIFEDVVATVGNGGAYQLQFRKSESVGPNAFALPAGIVVLTDELVTLAEDDGEIAAVLAHEVGHVVHRHALRRLIQNSMSAGLIIAVTGDLGSATNFAASLPTVLLNASYSRDFEREADELAFAYLETRGIATEELGELLIRMDEQAGRNPGRSTLLDSHPASRERLEAARQQHEE